MSEVLDLARDLIARPSVTPDDAGCQALVADRLSRAGFAIESLRFGEVDNLWATHGEGGPVLVLLGHTDVVPPGPHEAWTADPFSPEVRDGVRILDVGRARGPSVSMYSVLMAGRTKMKSFWK